MAWLFWSIVYCVLCVSRSRVALAGTAVRSREYGLCGAAARTSNWRRVAEGDSPRPEGGQGIGALGFLVTAAYVSGQPKTPLSKSNCDYTPLPILLFNEHPLFLRRVHSPIPPPSDRVRLLLLRCSAVLLPDLAVAAPPLIAYRTYGRDGHLV